MGKLATIYLSDEEARTLARFCEENRCTQYSAIKIAIKELTSERARSKAIETIGAEQTQGKLQAQQQTGEQAQAAGTHKSGINKISIMKALSKSSLRES
jgi:predicted transcriptional regulator